jgi:subtilisin family serine protease
MRRFAVLAIVVAVMSSMLSVGAAVPQDDAGSGRDAPDKPTASFRIHPHTVYSGVIEGTTVGENDDWYAFEAPANAALQARAASPIGCISLHDRSGAMLDTACATGFAELGRAQATSGSAGIYYVRFTYSQPTTKQGPPQAYRFSMGIWEDAPDPTPIPESVVLFPNPPPLPKVAPASQRDKHVVIAVVDTGINLYHDFFRASRLTDHPSRWVPGFPKSARSMRLSLIESNQAKALRRDTAMWDGVERSTYDPQTDRYDAHLYTFPGTRVIGGISFGEFTDATAPPVDLLPIHDDNGHGTHSAGLAAGANLPAADGNVLIVAVEIGQGFFEDGIRWAARQPWIDAITVSLGGRANAPVTFSPTGDRTGAEWATLEAQKSGKPVFIASGNGASGVGQAPDRCTTYTGEFTGPAWVTRVGAAKSDSENPTWWHCVPVDAIARTDVPSPSFDDLHKSSIAGGTSAATPNTAGTFAHLLLTARRQRLNTNRLSVLDHLLHSAVPPPPSAGASSPSQYPLSLADQGYGLVDEEAMRLAHERLRSRKGPQPRPETELWFQNDRAIRLALWGPGSATAGSVPLQDDAGTGGDAPDRMSGSIRIEPGVRYMGRLHGVIDGDRSDWYALTAAAGDTISLSASTVEACYEIVSPAGRVAAADCFASGGAISTTATARGTWFVHLSAGETPQPYTFGVGLNADPPTGTR